MNAFSWSWMLTNYFLEKLLMDVMSHIYSIVKKWENLIFDLITCIMLLLDFIKILMVDIATYKLAIYTPC